MSMTDSDGDETMAMAEKIAIAITMMIAHLRCYCYHTAILAVPTSEKCIVLVVF